MRSNPRADYLRRQLIQHARLVFTQGAADRLGREVRFTTLDEALRTRERVIVIPTEIVAPVRPGPSYQVPFNGTALTLWNPIARPPGEGWRAVPRDDNPLWYVHASGTFLPAWNLFGNVLDVLTFREEREGGARDRHGRFTAEHSPRRAGDLLRVPMFNEAAAVLLGGALGLPNGSPQLVLDEAVRPLIVVLSHDCDILRGNDFWTQGVRAFRAMRDPRRLGNLYWMAFNALRPRAHYFSNVTEMIELERELEFRSVFYLLNGTGGRFGARSGSAIVREVVRAIPSEWEVGIHYNYDTHLAGDRFEAQQRELAQLGAPALSCGRAHYLRFDSARSFSFLRARGIRFDESVGYYDYVGYRAGIAGAFQPLEPSGATPVDIWELPLVFMDGTLMETTGRTPLPLYERMLDHLAAIGGAVSVLVHPGVFRNPEFPEYLGLYREMLLGLRRRNARCVLPRALRGELDALRAT